MRVALEKSSAGRRPSRLRHVRVYLLGILALALLLFSQNLTSLVRYQATTSELSPAQLRSGGERIASELEGEIQRLASECLRAAPIDGLSLDPSGELSLEQARALRRTFDELKETHPIAEHFFLVTDGRVVYPRLQSPPPESLSSFLSLPGSAAAEEFRRLFLQAVSYEEGRRQPEKAEELYRRAETLAVPARLKALASYRAAHLGAGGSVSSVQAYRRHLEMYGDEYDQTQTPYALLMTSLPEPLAGEIFDVRTLSGIYTHVVEGRWELSAEQTDHYLSRLETRLGIDPGSRPPSDYLDQFVLGRAVRADGQSGKLSDAVGVFPRAIRLNNGAYQTYRTKLGTVRDHGAVVGFSVSMPWLTEDLLPRVSAEEFGWSLLSPLIRANAQTDDEEEGTVAVKFRTTLPYWHLHFPLRVVQAGQVEARREIWFLGLSSAMFLCVLGLGVYLLIVVSRDMHWYQLRSDFVSGVSHELKTPLSLIRLYSETLADGEQSFSPEERHGYVRIIARESQRLTHMIDNILSFSRFERGDRRGLAEEADLAAIVRQTVEDYSDYLALRGFTVRTGIQPDLPPVRINREQISQVVLNLLDNARKYSGDSRLLRVHMWRQDDSVVVQVQDHGLGIPEDQREKIFEPFYRLPASSQEGGCGLGLYLVRHVMEGLGGRVEVESEVGKGSKFLLFFPIAGASKQSRASLIGIGAVADRAVGNVES